MKNKTEVTEPISPNESKRFTELESVIRGKIGALFEVGEALSEIKEKRLYRADFKTFSDYCNTVWEFGRMRAYQLIEASETLNALPVKCKTGFTNVRQVNALAKLPKEKRVKVAKQIIKSVKSSGAKLTAKVVQAAVAVELGDETPAPTKPAPAAKPEPTGPITPAQFQSLLDAMRQRISGERKEHEKFGVILNRAANEEMNFGKHSGFFAYS